MWEHKKIAAYTGTRNLYEMMIPAVKSIICNSDVDEVWLFIEDDKFPDKYGMPSEIVKTRNVSDQRYFAKDGPNMNSGFTYMAMMRATYAKEFPELDRILSLDVDTIVDRDISALWDLPLLNDYYFAASKEPSATEKHGYLYTNIGVALYNLDKLRDGKCDEVIDELNRENYRYLEQDVFNKLCQGGIFEMDPTYNSTPFTKQVSNPCIVHYAGQKKWDGTKLYREYGNQSWKDVLRYRYWRHRK